METLTLPVVKAEELRIGNWVNTREGTTAVRILPHHILRVAEGHDSYSPILLTTKLLERAGFTISAFRALDYEIVLDAELMTKLTIGCADGQDDEWLTDGEAAISLQQNEWYTLPYKVLYLHALQNLYYSLTGEELEIEL